LFCTTSKRVHEPNEVFINRKGALDAVTVSRIVQILRDNNIDIVWNPGEDCADYTLNPKAAFSVRPKHNPALTQR